MTVGKNVELLMRKKKITQLSMSLAIDIDQGQLSRMIRGKIN